MTGTGGAGGAEPTDAGADVFDFCSLCKPYDDPGCSCMWQPSPIANGICCVPECCDGGA